MARAKTNRRKSKKMVISRNPILENPPGVVAHKYKRTFFGGNVTLTAADSGRAQAFSVGSLPGWADLANVYDAYTIDKVVVHWTFLTELAGVAVSQGQYPFMAYAPDYDDDTSPSTYQAVLQSSLAKIWFPTANDRHLSVEIKPRSSQVMASNGVAVVASGMAPFGQKIDVAFPDVKHYGIKYFPINYNTAGFPHRIVVHYETYFTMIHSRSG